MLALAACGDLPHPFQDNPGATAVRLSQPPPARLMVTMPASALLPDALGRVWAQDVAKALVVAELPAVAGEPHPDDWRLVLTVKVRDQMVVPTYTVQNPKGVEQGVVQGAPVPAVAWVNGSAATVQASASDAAPQIATLLTSIEAAREQSDPHSLLNRPARVYVAGVTGAPGDGNDMLARQMRLDLPKNGEVVQPTAPGADYTLRGKVRMVTNPDHKTQRVEIQWIVTDAQQREGGRIVQINDIPAGTLDHYWGDVAVVVAQQAAGGVRNVITNRLITHQKGGALPSRAAPGSRSAAPKPRSSDS